MRKKEKYLNFINELNRNYRCVRFVINLSMSSLGVFSDECFTFLDMINDIGIEKKQQLYIIKKMIDIAIGATYYISSCRNRNWDSPGLMQFWFSFFFFFSFCFVFFFFGIIQSQAANCKLPIRSEIYDIVHSKTQINFPLLLHYYYYYYYYCTLCDTMLERLKIQKKTARLCWLRPTDR